MKARWMVLALACTAALPVAEAAAQRPMVLGIGHSGWLGFSYSSSWTDEPGGIVVDTVIPESPAARAGLQKADTVVEVNGLRATPRLLGSLALEPGDVVELTVRRDGSERSLELTADERPAAFAYANANVFTLRTDSAFTMLRGMLDSARVRLDSIQIPHVYFRTLEGDSGRRAIIIGGDGESVDTIDFDFDFDTDSMRRHFRVFGDSMRTAFQFDMEPMRGFMHVGMNAVAGMELQALSPELGEYFGAQRGLLVLDVGDETPADRAGLEDGDVILRVEGRDVDSISGLRRAIRRTDGDEVEIVVLRQRREVELELPVRR